MDEDSWNNGSSDVPIQLDGLGLAEDEDSIRRAVEQRNNEAGGNLIQYFDEERNPGVKEKVVSAIPSVEIRDGKLVGCTTVKLRAPLTEPEMEDFKDYLKGQFSDGWDEGLEQQEIKTADGVLNVHFWSPGLCFEAERVEPPPDKEQEQPPRRPKMKLVGEDGNIFAILGRASRLLKRNGQAEQAEEMNNRVYHSGDYYKALNIISEYVETELSEKTPADPKKERGNVR